MSDYVVTARKWRPQTFEDVVGQKAITQTLQNAIRSNRVGHAFIFSGARGVGKTTTARILARALNCHSGPAPEPCGECVSCREIAAGNSLDVFEIDAASNTGVDNIRELREAVQYRTARDRFKIYIIDEVHMLSNAAFNALLKTLEEPPAHVKFIMATTEPHRVPATILSRCQQFEFRMISYQEILDRLRRIAEADQIQISDYALRLLCSASEGSMRDAQSALDQIIAYSGREVNDSDVRSLLGVVTEESLNAVVDAIIRKDRRALLDEVGRAARHGHNLQIFCRKLLEQCRHLLVIKAAGFDPEMIPASPSQAERLQQQAENFSEIDLLRIYDFLSRAEGELRWHPHPLFHLEITLLKILQLAHLEEIEKLLSRSQPLRRGEQRQGNGEQRQGKRSADTAAAPATAADRRDPVELSPAPAGDTQPARACGPDAWVQSLLQAAQRERPALSAFLEKAQILADPAYLLIRFAEKQKVAVQFVEEASNRIFLEGLWKKIAGTSVRLRVEVAAPAAAQAEGANLHRALQDPRVQLLAEAFPGKISIEDLEE
ncbi:MAG: DNA polymerase III subunit gamma/tau [Acidobacteria bacterium]|nr:DNA polymerase III subunit gamma/tau [Acidobacteriota bacterium]